MFKKVHVFRVKPKQELVTAIADYCREHSISSGIVLGIIGSAESARLLYLLGLPAKYESIDYTGPLEIVCAQGSVATMNGDTVLHIHVQLSEHDVCQGGHLVKAIVFSTAEVTIGELDFPLRRQLDSYTGLNELE